MSFAVVEPALIRLAARIEAIKRRVCGASRDAESIKPDGLYDYFKNRFLALGIDLDGPELVGDGGAAEFNPPPRRAARRGYRWVLVNGKWVEVRQQGGGD